MKKIQSISKKNTFVIYIILVCQFDIMLLYDSFLYRSLISMKFEERMSLKHLATLSIHDLKAQKKTTSYKILYRIPLTQQEILEAKFLMRLKQDDLQHQKKDALGYFSPPKATRNRRIKLKVLKRLATPKIQGFSLESDNPVKKIISQCNRLMKNKKNNPKDTKESFLKNPSTETSFPIKLPKEWNHLSQITHLSHQ